MNRNSITMRLGLAAVVLAAVGFAGCSEPAPIPIDQRKPGQDLSPQDRADKRGDVPVVGGAGASGVASPTNAPPAPDAPTTAAPPASDAGGK